MALLKALDAAKQETGLTQSELARRFGVSQGHLSKVLRRSAPLSEKLKRRVETFLAEHQRSSGDVKGWLEVVGRTARRSREFREVVSATLRLMHFNAYIESRNRRKRD